MNNPPRMSGREIGGEMTKSKQACAGCYNDDYNHGLGGSKECWSFESATMFPRIAISVDQSPPYDKDQAKQMMSCYTRKRMVYVKPEALDDLGYWK